jgi:hypothetical protein
MTSSSVTYGYDAALKSLLYDRFADTIGISLLSSDKIENMNQGLFQCPFEIAQREASEKRSTNFLEFMHFYRMGMNPSWDRQRTVLAQRGLWALMDKDADKRLLTNIKAQPVDLLYSVWFWSKNWEKLNLCMEDYIFWQQENPKVEVSYDIGDDKYPIAIRPDLHFGEIVDESTYPEKYEVGTKFIIRMPIKMDGWVFKSTTLKPIRKIRLTVYDKDDVTDYSEIIGPDPNTGLEQALKFFRKSIYNIIAVSILDGKITVAGKYGIDFSVGEKIVIRDSTGNDGMYTVSIVSQGADSTVLVVEEPLYSSVVDGVIQKRN